MRQIIFRGRKKGERRWVHGEYTNPNGARPAKIDGWQVKEETVGQYIWKTDKNGDQVYEGDVLTNGKSRAVVAFDKERCAFVLDYGFTVDLLEDIDFDTWEIIGNIHDNPDLVK